MTNAYWTLDSWGDAYPPENAQEIIDRANGLIDEYAEIFGDDLAAEYSEHLWNTYCMTGTLPEEA